MNRGIYSEDHRFLVSQLRKARKAVGLNQTEVGRLLGKTHSHISKVESGQRRIDVWELKEFARIYKKKLEWFIAK